MRLNWHLMQSFATSALRLVVVAAAPGPRISCRSIPQRCQLLRRATHMMSGLCCWHPTSQACTGFKICASAAAPKRIINGGGGGGSWTLDPLQVAFHSEYRYGGSAALCQSRYGYTRHCAVFYAVSKTVHRMLPVVQSPKHCWDQVGP